MPCARSYDERPPMIGGDEEDDPFEAPFYPFDDELPNGKSNGHHRQ